MTTPNKPDSERTRAAAGAGVPVTGTVRVVGTDETKPAPIPTGFPEPVAPDEPRPPAADGKVRLAPVGFGYLTVPPLGEGGEQVVITAEGTDVDQATAERAHEAARLAGFTLREV